MAQCGMLYAMPGESLLHVTPPVVVLYVSNFVICLWYHQGLLTKVIYKHLICNAEGSTGTHA